VHRSYNEWLAEEGRNIQYKLVDVFKPLSQTNRLLLNTFLMVVAIALFFMVLNSVTFGFRSNQQFLHSHWIITAPVMLILLWCSTKIQRQWSTVASVSRAFVIQVLIIGAIYMLLCGAQYTPFPVLNHAFASFDHLFMMHESFIAQFTCAHLGCSYFLLFLYLSILLQVFVVPVMLCALRQEVHCYRVFLATLVMGLLAAGIYYFFPSGVMYHMPGGVLPFLSKGLFLYHFHGISPQISVFNIPSLHAATVVMVTYAFYPH